jgi:hypothetical protein
MQSAIEFNVPGTEPVASSRSIWFWVACSAVAASQLVAFWLLCNHQVSLADERRSEIQVRSIALADCLQDVRGSTVSSCRAHLAARHPETVIVAPPVNGTLPVGFNFR